MPKASLGAAPERGNLYIGLKNPNPLAKGHIDVEIEGLS